VAPTLFSFVIAAVESLWKKTMLTFRKPPRFIPENERKKGPYIREADEYMTWRN